MFVFLFPYIIKVISQTMAFNVHKRSGKSDSNKSDKDMLHNDDNNFNTYNSIHSQEQLAFNSFDKVLKFAEVLRMKIHIE